jgi:signal transduction histidine kinase
VAIVVDDSGRGIPVEHLPHVFDRFYRVDSSRDARSGGSGLGLSIVRAVVERHGGRVSAGTSPLGGARFTIELPRDGSGLDADLSDSGTPA